MDEHDACLTSAQVKRRYAVSDMAIWRWLHDPAIGFPPPFKIGKRNYWRLSDLQTFELRCAVHKAPSQPDVREPETA
jgi:predicted DNA-binding transcriptional regulator AlpA